MNLVEIMADMRIELSDPATFWSDAELTRAVQKSVGLMSRFIPKRSIVETTLVREVTDESLTISSDTGTLTYKPIKVGSLVITGKTLDTDYRVNYMTGVVTEIGALLPDASYTANYDLDPLILDIATLLPEESHIKIERVEYPAGDDPSTYLTFEVFGEMLLIKGKDVALTEDKHLRIIYLKPWTAPVTATDGDYPEHLDNAVIIGSCGQALILKAEKYVQSSITENALVNTAADSMATPLADINTALDKVATYVTDADTAFDAAVAQIVLAATALAKINNDSGRTYLTDADGALDSAATALTKIATYLENNTNEDAKSWLTKITTDIAGLRTAFLTAVDAANAELDASDFTAVATHLTEADAALDKVAVYLESSSAPSANITDEVSVAPAVDTWKDLANSPISPGTEVVTSSDGGTTFVKDTDYTINYADGKYTIIAAAGITEGDSLLFDYTITVSGSEGSTYWLTKITTDIADLRTAISTALASALADFGEVETEDLDKATTGAGAYLDEGDGSITTINDAEKVAGQYADYARTRAAIATARTNAALGFLQEVTQRLSNLRSYIEQAGAWGDVATGFVSEAIQRVSMSNQILGRELAIATQADSYLKEAVTRMDNLRSYIEQADGWGRIGAGFAAEAVQRINEAVARTGIADRYLTEAGQRAQAASAYVAEGSGRLAMSRAFIEEGNTRIGEVNAWAVQADRYALTSGKYLEIAGRYLASGQAKINEFLIMLGIKPELYNYKGSSEQSS